MASGTRAIRSAPPRPAPPRALTHPALLLTAILAPLISCGGTDAPDPEPPLEPLFSLAVITDLHISGALENEQRLQAAVQWIDDHAAERSIELVLVLGDIGWGSTIERSKELLDELDVPYVPINGDNEIHAGDEEAFRTLYQPQYDSLAATLDGWRMAPVPVLHPGTGQDAWLQNAAFEYQGLHVLAVDWCVRGADGLAGEVGDLHDYEGGSWRWLSDELTGLEPTLLQSVVIISHIPMFGGMFSLDQMAQITGLIAPRRDYVYANLSGHLHGNLVMEEEGFDAIVTDATFDDDNTVRVIEVQGNGVRLAYEHELIVVP